MAGGQRRPTMATFKPSKFRLVRTIAAKDDGPQHSADLTAQEAFEQFPDGKPGHAWQGWCPERNSWYYIANPTGGLPERYRPPTA